MNDPGREERRGTPASVAPAPQRRTVFDLELEASVCVARARPTVAALAEMGKGTLVPLEEMPNDLVELRVGDQVVARGTLEEMEDGSDRLALRLVEVFDGATA